MRRKKLKVKKEHSRIRDDTKKEIKRRKGERILLVTKKSEG